jgi:hypothetical protein
MKTMLISIATILFFVFPGKDVLTGRWESKVSPKGNVTGIVFKEDNSFEGYVNRKPFTSGKYTLKDSIFSFTDTGCNGVPGTYQLVFFSNGDSLRFQPIADTCLERKNGMSRLVVGKVNK